LGLVAAAFTASLLRVLATFAFADVGGRAAIGTVVVRSARVGSGICGGGWSGVLLPDEQGMVGDGGDALGVKELLHKEVGTSTDEGVWSPARYDGGDGMAIFGDEATQHIEYLAGLETGWPTSCRLLARTFSLAQ
jgi:hypothetical protein